MREYPTACCGDESRCGVAPSPADAPQLAGGSFTQKPITPKALLAKVEEILKKTNQQQFRAVYFRGLGHFFGRIVRNEGSGTRFEVDSDVLKTLSGWLDERCRDIDRQLADEKKEKEELNGITKIQEIITKPTKKLV